MSRLAGNSRRFQPLAGWWGWRNGGRAKTLHTTMISNHTNHPWKIIAAIAFFLAVLFLFLPYLWRTTENVAVMLVAILLLAPLVRTVSEYLLSDAPPPHAIKALLAAMA